jgi:hypothetical protein
MARLRRLVSSVVIFSLLPTLFHGPLRQVVRAHQAPSRYGVDAKRALTAYALYVRAQMGDRDTAKARKFLSELRIENLSPETMGWLLSLMSAGCPG